MLSSDNIIEKTKYKIFYVSPKTIEYCILPSEFCDYTQFNSSRLHPHAGKDGGVFKENIEGYIRVNRNNWDNKPGILFSKLLEYTAIENHFNGKENWKHSKFAERNIKYIRENNNVRNFENPNNFLIEREKQIDFLFESILKKGVNPLDLSKDKKLFIDNISIVLTKDLNLYFNNR